MAINYYDGSAWAAGVPKYWDGSQWVEVPVKVWDGSQWVTVHAVGVTLIDSYETDLSDYGYGTPSDFNIQSSVGVTDGSSALEYVGGDSFAHILSDSGLNAYPGAGDTFTYDVTFQDSTNELLVAWCTQGTSWVPSSYAVRLDGDTSSFSLEKSTGSGFSNLDSAAHTFSAVPYRAEVAHGGSGSITATLFDDTDSQLAQVSVSNETDYSAGGFAVEARAHAGGTSAGPVLDYPRIL